MVLAAHRVQITERGRRRVVGALLAGAALLVLYWAAWLLAAGGSAGFLLGMDLLYNLQHGIWFASHRGLLELLRNLATAAGTIGLFAWTWPRRAELLAGN
jgi:hypothetical protein